MVRLALVLLFLVSNPQPLTLGCGLFLSTALEQGSLIYRLETNRSKLCIVYSDFLDKKQSTLTSLCLLSKWNPLRWTSIWFNKSYSCGIYTVGIRKSLRTKYRSQRFLYFAKLSVAILDGMLTLPVWRTGLVVEIWSEKLYRYDKSFLGQISNGFVQNVQKRFDKVQ